jgi:hypothetical protein
VELKYGLFIYEDDTDSRHSTGYKMSTSSASSSSAYSNKKMIHLMPEFCTCDRSKKSKEPVFVLTTHTRESSSRKKRKFRCSSEEDLEAWLESIRIAMV